MTQHDEFEKQARRALEESVARLDGATRSRLTQARHRALAQLETDGARSIWRRWFAGRGALLAPVGAAAAVVALTTVLWVGRPDNGLPGDATTAAAGSFEDIDLLADGEALAAISEEDPEFYEWALAQDAAGDSTVGS